MSVSVCSLILASKVCAFKMEMRTEFKGGVKQTRYSVPKYLEFDLVEEDRALDYAVFKLNGIKVAKKRRIWMCAKMKQRPDPKAVLPISPAYEKAVSQSSRNSRSRLNVNQILDQAEEMKEEKKEEKKKEKKEEEKTKEEKKQEGKKKEEKKKESSKGKKDKDPGPKDDKDKGTGGDKSVGAGQHNARACFVLTDQENLPSLAQVRTRFLFPQMHH